MMLNSQITIDGVDRIWRPGTEWVYKGKVTIGGLAHALNNNTVLYAPKYQRGFKDTEANPSEYEKLYMITDPGLRIDHKRCQSMAVKYLIGLTNWQSQPVALYNSDIIWNVRQDPDGRVQEPYYDETSRKLTVYSKITVPDSGHRHYAYWLLNAWKNDPDSIPAKVQYEQEGRAVSGDDIEEMLEDFDPHNRDKAEVFVEIYNLLPEVEGYLFDEFNDESKRPGTARSIAQAPKKTPARRFVTELMSRSDVLSEHEVQTASNSISSKSRKLTTNSTLVSAARAFGRPLLTLEESGSEAVYDDLVEFFCAFVLEWASHFPVMQPGVPSAEDRHEFRRESFAISNIIFFPLFKLAFGLWDKYRENGTDWRTETEWRDGLARLAGDTEAEDGETYAVMSRENPDWQGRILVKKFDGEGNFTGWSLSSTRQTRAAAYQYVAQKAEVAV